jgi:hypothetical protein
MSLPARVSKSTLATLPTGWPIVTPLVGRVKRSGTRQASALLPGAASLYPTYNLLPIRATRTGLMIDDPKLKYRVVKPISYSVSARRVWKNDAVRPTSIEADSLSFTKITQPNTKSINGQSTEYPPI